MGVLRGMECHYRSSNAANSCQAGVVTMDDPADYSTVDLAACVLQLGVPVWAKHDGVTRPEDPGDFGDSGTWHYRSECPDQ